MRLEGEKECCWALGLTDAPGQELPPCHHSQLLWVQCLSNAVAVNRLSNALPVKCICICAKCLCCQMHLHLLSTVLLAVKCMLARPTSAGINHLEHTMRMLSKYMCSAWQVQGLASAGPGKCLSYLEHTIHNEAVRHPAGLSTLASVGTAATPRLCKQAQHARHTPTHTTQQHAKRRAEGNQEQVRPQRAPCSWAVCRVCVCGATAAQQALLQPGPTYLMRS